MPVQIQLSCPLAEQALAASVAAGQRVVALGREWLAAHRAVDLFMPNTATRAGAGVEHASAAIVAAHTLGAIPVAQTRSGRPHASQRQRSTDLANHD
jgi:pyrroline-5-carboxylate reductase